MFSIFKNKILRNDPIGIIFAEDNIGLTDSIDHLLQIGFKNIFIIGLPNNMILARKYKNLHHIQYDIDATGAITNCLNSAISAFPDYWIFHCFNSEFLYFPFSETRKIQDFLLFSDDEKRFSVFGTIVDLYTKEPHYASYGYSSDNCYFDSTGYYAEYRSDNKGIMSRFVTLHGGLRWRFEEHFPWHRRKINRVPLFKAQTGLILDNDQNMDDFDFGTIQADWHRSPTVVITSFRAAKYLHINITDQHLNKEFFWANSIQFRKKSHQLMGIGLMEPGQWI